jgi:hypothetical protein
MMTMTTMIVNGARAVLNYSLAEMRGHQSVVE